jgi:hypothetical protein
MPAFLLPEIKRGLFCGRFSLFTYVDVLEGNAQQ